MIITLSGKSIGTMQIDYFEYKNKYFGGIILVFYKYASSHKMSEK